MDGLYRFIKFIIAIAIAIAGYFFYVLLATACLSLEFNLNNFRRICSSANENRKVVVILIAGCLE